MIITNIIEIKSLLSGKHFKNRGTIIELPPVMSTFELPHKKERHG